MVFGGSFLASLGNLIYQLIIAHSLSVVDFAAFSSLLSIFSIVSSPLVTMQLAISKYTAEFSARGQSGKIIFVFRRLSAIFAWLGLVMFTFFCLFSFFSLSKLKIDSPASALILSGMFFLTCFVPLFNGVLQGLELFWWICGSSVLGVGLKLIFTVIFVSFGLKVAGALGAFAISLFIAAAVCLIPLGRINSSGKPDPDVDMRGMFWYILPIAATNFCYLGLVSSDMILVKYFFSPENSGVYSLAQVAGKIFLFLPGAISIVMFPRVSRLNAQNNKTRGTLTMSLTYGFILSVCAVLVYNFFPDFILRSLTGKAPLESIALGRFFSVSMSLFALLYILMNYFISLKDWRFLKYLVISAACQALAIILFHADVFQVQFILCLNALILFLVFLGLAYGKKMPRDKR